jgi:hypothetical protein
MDILRLRGTLSEIPNPALVENLLHSKDYENN